MQRVAPHTADFPLFDVAKTRRIEAAALAGLPAHALMRRAGAAVAQLALALAPHARRVRIVAGPGNNGGDGLEAAVQLQHAGKQVEVVLVAEPGADDARDALARARDAGIVINPPALSLLDASDLVIDAVLGIGARRAPEGALRAAIESLGALPCIVLAVDLPSGLDAGTGQPLGACVRADHTLSLLTLKPGLFTSHGRDQAGKVWLDDLGVAAHGESPDAWLGGADMAAVAPRDHAQHKGSFGDVVVVGGASGMCGAALLAGRAAHAAGAGRVFVELLDPAGPALDACRPELMLRPGWSRKVDAAALSGSTVVCGCGGGDAVRGVLPRLLSTCERLVLDADALNVLASDEMLQRLLSARAARGHTCVITPHPLEAARLLGCTSAQVQSNRLGTARELADKFRCIIVLKGSGSVLAAPGRTPRINASGNASLATAGTGDVLAGWIGGQWAQRGEVDVQERGWRAAVGSTWLHGAAADEALRPVMRAADLIEKMASPEAR